MVIRRLSFLLVLLALAAGCGYGDNDEEESTPNPPAAAVPRLPDAEADGTVPVEEFNDYLEEARPAFATSPLRTAIEFAHVGEGQAATTSVVVEEGPEGGGDEASVVVTRDGLADDSVRAVRYEIALERAGDGTWRLRSARRLQRCQTGRGHQDFTAQLCT